MSRGPLDLAPMKSRQIAALHVALVQTKRPVAADAPLILG